MLKDIGLENGKLVIRNTGARIDINREFMREVASVASFTVEVSAISAARAAKDQLIRRADRRPIRICFLPEMPHVWYAIWPVCTLAGIDIVKTPAEADVLFYFQDTSHTDVAPYGGTGAYMINGSCVDIRKSRVAEVFEEVFGYGLKIDPLTHSGLALMKSERNGVHDGQIIPCPYYTPRPGHVYQRLVDNTADGKTYIDIRTPVVGGSLPVIYLKHRTSSNRFSNHNDRVILSSAEDQFSPEEREKILTFAQRIGLEFGGLDVLRNRRDGRLYIVDVNKTDMGPPTALPRREKLIAMEKLAEAFRIMALEKSRKPVAA